MKTRRPGWRTSRKVPEDEVARLLRISEMMAEKGAKWQPKMTLKYSKT